MLSTKLELHKLPGGGAQFPLRTVWAVHKERLASEEYSMERERKKKSNCRAETPDKHYLKSSDQS